MRLNDECIITFQITLAFSSLFIPRFAVRTSLVSNSLRFRSVLYSCRQNQRKLKGFSYKTEQKLSNLHQCRIKELKLTNRKCFDFLLLPAKGARGCFYVSRLTTKYGKTFGVSYYQLRRLILTDLMSFPRSANLH